MAAESTRHSTYDTIIIGAGAAGLMCALTAGQRGRRNFTNLHVSPERFLSANPHFCKSALSRYSQWDFIELLDRHHIFLSVKWSM